MNGSRRRLAGDRDVERKVDLDLPLPGVNGALDDPGKGNFVLADTHTAGGQRRIKFRIGSLAGRKDEGNELRHSEIFPTKVTKKAG